MSESMVLDTILRDIRAKCLDCMGGHRNAVAACKDAGCPLHRYRMTRREMESVVLEHGTDEPIGVQMDMETMIARNAATA